MSLSRRSFENLQSIVQEESYSDVLEALGRISLEAIPRKEKNSPLEDINNEIMLAVLRVKKVEPLNDR